MARKKARKKAARPKLHAGRHPQAIDWDAWRASLDAARFFIGQAQGQYLENRINRAFAAGWHAAAKRYKPESETPNDRD